MSTVPLGEITYIWSITSFKTKQDIFLTTLRKLLCSRQVWSQFISNEVQWKGVWAATCTFLHWKSKSKWWSNISFHDVWNIHNLSLLSFLSFCSTLSSNQVLADLHLPLIHLAPKSPRQQTRFSLSARKYRSNISPPKFCSADTGWKARTGGFSFSFCC